MPITTKHGSIFDSRASVLVCPVNCVGVMGKGLALEFKRRKPLAALEYERLCKQKAVTPGDVWRLSRDVIAVATKNHWRKPSRIEWVETAIAGIAAYTHDNLPSIAIPQLGCGCGGLDWADVWPLYERHLGELDADVEVWIYE